VRWLDFNDTWLAAEWGHPSDNLGAILAVADWMNRQALRDGGKPITVRDVLGWAIKAHEIQGVYALQNSFNRVGLDHVILGPPGFHGGRHRDAGRHEGRNRHRRLAFVDRQRRAAHLSPRAEHRPAQELGRGRCLPPRRHARAECGDKKVVGYPERAEREDLGLLRRRVQGQGSSSSSARSAAT
jgi:hypothetical protein